jgi:hypothetical protein
LFAYVWLLGRISTIVKSCGRLKMTADVRNHITLKEGDCLIPVACLPVKAQAENLAYVRSFDPMRKISKWDRPRCFLGRRLSIRQMQSTSLLQGREFARDHPHTAQKRAVATEKLGTGRGSGNNEFKHWGGAYDSAGG